MEKSPQPLKGFKMKTWLTLLKLVVLAVVSWGKEEGRYGEGPRGDKLLDLILPDSTKCDTCSIGKFLLLLLPENKLHHIPVTYKCAFHGRFPSASMETGPCATAATDLQRALKGVQGGD